MLLTERLTWENTEQELVECDAINLIYELRALILAYWLTTLWRLANIPRRMWKAADMFRLRLFFPELIWWRGIEHNWESGVKFHCAQTSKKIAFSTHFSGSVPSSLWLGRMENFILTTIAMKGMGLLLCKPWKWSSHAVCLCALSGLLPRPNVYSLTAHSYQASAFEVTAHSANMLMGTDYIKVRQSRQQCRLSLTHIGTVFNMAFHLLLNQAKRSLRKQTNNLDFWGLKHMNKNCCMCTFHKHRRTYKQSQENKWLSKLSVMRGWLTSPLRDTYIYFWLVRYLASRHPQHTLRGNK